MLEPLEAWKPHELLRLFEYVLDRGAVSQRARDCAHELRQREGRLLRGQPVRAEQARGELVAIDRRLVWTNTVMYEPPQLAPAEPVFRGVRLPLLAQARELDLLFLLADR